MTSDTSQNENIQTFLQRLKLADKYADLLISNGYLTVNDCSEITEDKLKEMGITLPGHYRRILHKLPGLNSNEPERPKQTVSIDNAKSPGESPFLVNRTIASLNDKTFQLEPDCDSEVSEKDDSKNNSLLHSNSESQLITLADSSVQPILEDRLTITGGRPKKPPRSPQNLRKSNLQLITPEDSGSYYHLQFVPETQNQEQTAKQGDSTPLVNNLSEAISQFLQNPVISQISVDEAKDDLTNIDDSHFRDKCKVEGVENALSESSFMNMSLPPLMMTESNTDFPSTDQTSGILHDISQANDPSDVYDHLDIAKIGIDKQTPIMSNQESSNIVIDVASDPYSKLSTHISTQRQATKVIQNNLESNQPALSLPTGLNKSGVLPQYEVISLAREVQPSYQPNFEEPREKSDQEADKNALVFGSLPQNKDNAKVFTLNRFSKATSDLYESVKLDGDDESLNSNISRSKSVGVHDATCMDTTIDSSNDNVYHLCEDDFAVTSKKISRGQTRHSKSASLPRSTGFNSSYSSSPYQDSKGLVINHRQNNSKHSSNDSISSTKVYSTASDVLLEVDDTYQSITDMTEPNKLNVATPRNVRANTGSKLNAHKFKLRLKQKKRRPASAMVDGFKPGHLGHPHSSSDEHVDTCADRLTTKGRHNQRTVSTSSSQILGYEALPGLDMVDAQLTQNNRCESAEQSSPLVALSQKKIKKGYLNKHGGREGRTIWQKRWVVFDGEELTYYENEKSDVSKGIVPIEVIVRVQVAKEDPRIFHILTQGGRKFVFSAETGDEEAIWTSTILAAKMLIEKQTHASFKPGGCMYMPYKEGFLKMDGSRQKNYLATKADLFAYYKSIAEFNYGQPIAKLSMKIATVKEVDKKKFQLIFPFRTYTLAADNEEEKRSWIEALNDAIAEGLSDYKVVSEIWMLDSNQKCADCGREDPDWASINLAIIICKHCAGVHRDLGVHNSKVRSLKMDVKIWNDTMKNLLLMVGNDVAHSFWCSRLKSSDAITDMADKKQRQWHITSKYIEMRYVEPHKYAGNQELLNQSLINAVRSNNLKEAYTLLFSGADPNCDTGKTHGKTPHLLSKHLGYDTMAEFLYQNGATEDVSPQGHVTGRSACISKKDSLPKTTGKPPVMLRDCLYKYGGDFKSTVDENKPSRGLGLIRIALQQAEFQKRMCVLENNCFKYYDPDKTSILKDEVDCSELTSIGLCQPEQALRAGYQYSFDVSRCTGRTYLFCTERKEIINKWTQGLMQAIVPAHVQNAMKHDTDFDRIGKLWMKSQHRAKKSSEWISTWFRLKGKNLHYYHIDAGTMETIDLRRLVQLGLDLTQEGTTAGNGPNMKEGVPTFMLVFREKSYYLRSETKSDSECWLAIIRKADSTCGPNLTDQQLTSEGVPVILEKCITFIEQFGLSTRGIYRLSGTHTKTTQLLADFKQNARESQMRDTDLNVHDVANALKRWFKGLPGSLLTEDLHEQFIDTSQIQPEHHARKLEWYKHLIDKLPEINRNSLKVLLVHLNNVAGHENENEMSLPNLAIVFGPTLMKSQGADDGNQSLDGTSQQITCVDDLLRYYGWLFDVTECDREKERLMLEAKEKISAATQQQNMLTTLDYDMMVPIYFNKKEDKCVNYKVNIEAGELIARICVAHNHPASSFGLFEVTSDGDAERPLHPSEHVLSVIKAWEMPSTNYLLAKHDYTREKFHLTKTLLPNIHGTELLVEGQLKVYDSKKKWLKVIATLKNVKGVLTLTYGKSKAANTVTFGLYNVYLGVDRKTKPTTSRSLGFTLAARDQVTRYFTVDNEKNLYNWVCSILLHKHPEGFTPPPSPALTPANPSPTTRFFESRSVKRPALPILSQQELGEAVKAAAIQRKSSSSGDEISRENPYEMAAASNITAKPLEVADPAYEESTQLPTSSARPTSLAPISFVDPVNSRNRSAGSYGTSPMDQPRGSFLGMKLHSELSSVLKKRNE